MVAINDFPPGYNPFDPPKPSQMIEHVDTDRSLALSKATRIEVVDAQGRQFVGYYQPGMTIDVQDDGTTIKVFAKEGSPSPLRKGSGW